MSRERGGVGGVRTRKGGREGLRVKKGGEREGGWEGGRDGASERRMDEERLG